jgi:hypothetical protein
MYPRCFLGFRSACKSTQKCRKERETAAAAREEMRLISFINVAIDIRRLEKEREEGESRECRAASCIVKESPLQQQKAEGFVWWLARLGDHAFITNPCTCLMMLSISLKGCMPHESPQGFVFCK